MNPDLFRQELAKMDIILSEKQMEQFNNYYQLLIEWNNKINLTAITKLNEVYLKHFYDSIVLIEAMPKEKKDLLFCDVGSGAGFPSIPLKIVYPELKISIVDSLNKRIKFLDMLCNKLGLNHVSLHHERAEIFGQDSKNRESFDIVTARAVARLNVLSELCLPLVKKDGYFLALKAAQSETEMIESKKAIAMLGGKMEKEIVYNLPFSNDKRYIIKVQKKKETPNKYPRKPGIPNKKPLI